MTIDMVIMPSYQNIIRICVAYIPKYITYPPTRQTTFPKVITIPYGKFLPRVKTGQWHVAPCHDVQELYREKNLQNMDIEEVTPESSNCYVYVYVHYL